MTNGMEQSEEKIEEQLRSFEKILDDYTNKIGLDKIIYNEDVEDILLLDERQLSGLDRNSLDEYAFILIQYATVLNKEINRNKVRLFWAEDKLNKFIAKYHNKYSGQFMKFETIKYTIINNDSAAKILNQIIVHAQSRILEIDGIVNNIQMMSKIISNIGRSK